MERRKEGASAPCVSSLFSRKDEFAGHTEEYSSETSSAPRPPPSSSFIAITYRFGFLRIPWLLLLIMISEMMMMMMMLVISLDLWWAEREVNCAEVDAIVGVGNARGIWGITGSLPKICEP